MALSSLNSDQMSTAKPAAIAAPRAVVSRIDGRSTGMPMMFACVWRKYLSAHSRSTKVGQASAYLHANVRVTHASIYGKCAESVTTILLHGVQNSLGLEAGCLKSCACDVASLCVLCDTLLKSKKLKSFIFV